MQPAVRSIVTVLLLVSLGSGAFPAYAQMLPSTGVPPVQPEQLAKQRADNRARLEAEGVDRDEAQARVSSLTDAEVSHLTAGFDRLPAGRGDPRAFATALGLFVTVYVVIKLLPLFIIGGAATLAARSGKKNAV